MYTYTYTYIYMCVYVINYISYVHNSMPQKGHQQWFPLCLTRASGTAWRAVAARGTARVVSGARPETKHVAMAPAMKIKGSKTWSSHVASHSIMGLDPGIPNKWWDFAIDFPVLNVYNLHDCTSGSRVKSLGVWLGTIGNHLPFNRIKSWLLHGGKSKSFKDCLILGGVSSPATLIEQLSLWIVLVRQTLMCMNGWLKHVICYPNGSLLRGNAD